MHPDGSLPTLSSKPPRRQARADAFTLIELLLSISILAVLMLVVTNVIGVVQKTWVQSNNRVSEFREARMAMDILTRNLSQATLNAYWQSVDNAGSPTKTFMAYSDRSGAQATAYVRQSELQFVAGRTSTLLGNASPDNYPGHGVFFQGTLGTTRLEAIPGTGTGNAGSPPDTENMVNLLCGRGYFVTWGDDAGFKPAFLQNVATVKSRHRYRLMEYSPTAEMNKIYFDPASPNDVAARKPISDPSRTRQWFQTDVLSGNAQASQNEQASNRAFVRPVADNIICLVLSPQLDAKSAGNEQPTKIAPNYEFDSALVHNPGTPPPPAAPAAGSQGTQHLLPPLVKITMIVVDSATGEKLAEQGGNNALRQDISNTLNGRFLQANQFTQDLDAVIAKLIEKRINYRIFSSTVGIKQARWSI